MTPFIRLLILALAPGMLAAQTRSSDPGGVLRQLTVARFAGSGAESIQAITCDAAGFIYVAGTTSSPALSLRNAAQPAFGDAMLMRSDDRGLSWKKLPVPPALLLTVAPHPADPQTLFVGAADGIYKTTDGGVTWRHIYAWPPEPYCALRGHCYFYIAIDPLHPAAVYAYTYGTASRFLSSSDGGESWHVRDLPRDLQPIGIDRSAARVLWVDPNGSGIVAIGTWLSRDHGLTWARMAPLPNGAPDFTVPDPRYPGWIYAAKSTGTSGHLYLSKDWGATWTERPAPRRNSDPEPVAIRNLLFDPDLPSTIYASDVWGFLDISNDAGASWHALGSGLWLDSEVRQALLSRQCGGGAILAVAVEQRTVVSSLDFGANWQPVPLSRVLDLVTGAGCRAYALRQAASDAFVAKLAPGGGEVLWSTFLGGADADAPSAIALDAKGNVYVAGNTASADFPATSPRTGPQRQQNVFAAKFDPSGTLTYSVVLGGESSDGVTSLAVSAEGEAHLVGWTSSKSFPATPGAFRMERTSDGDGFAVKLAAGGTAIYASYLPNFATYRSDPFTMSPPRALAVTLDAGQDALIGGYQGMLSRMSLDGSALTDLPRQPGQIFAMAADGEGNIYVAGQVTAGHRSGSCSLSLSPGHDTLSPGDIFVTKLKPDGVQPVFSTRLWGQCQTWPRFLSVGPGGEATISLWTYGRFPLRNPVLPQPTGTAAIARLGADGSALLFSSYLDGFQPASIALAPDASIYAGIPSIQGTGDAGVLQIPVAVTGGPTVEGVFESFGGGPGNAAPDSLLTISGQNLAPEFIDLGLNNPNPLPLELGGVRVLFDGLPTEMFQVAPDHIICVAPATVAGKASAAVQIVINGQMAPPFFLPTGYNSGFLTQYFPALPPAGSVDGNIRNADGTLNGPDHPAAPGSTVTLFAHGLGGLGSSIPLLWNAPPVQRYELIQALSGTVRRVPGFIHPLFAVDLRIPDAPGPGVYLVPKPGVLTRAEIGRVGNGIGVYVK